MDRSEIPKVVKLSGSITVTVPVKVGDITAKNVSANGADLIVTDEIKMQGDIK